MSVVLFLATICVVSAQHADFDFYSSTGPFPVQSANAGGFRFYYPKYSGSDRLPLYVYSVGTAATAGMYASTLNHVASHGFVTCVSAMTNANALAAIDFVVKGSGLPDDIRAMVDTSRIATCGHSGGGPVSFHALVHSPHNVMAWVGQHAAAIPLVNAPRPSDYDVFDGKQAQMMALCGTVDVMPFCGCNVAKASYFDKVKSKRVKIEVPDAHITGVIGPTGDKFEGGYVVAFLHLTLKNWGEALDAIKQGKRGDNIEINWGV